MALRYNFCDRFWAIVQQEIRRRVEQCLPCPDNVPVGVRLNNVTISELKQEYPTMATKEMSVTLSGDAPFGYMAEGLTFVNKAGNPVDPAPAADAVSVSSSDDTIATGSYVGDGKMVISVADTAAPGTMVDVTVSADATGTEDDAVFHITVGTDRLASVDLGGVVVRELDAAP